MAEIWHIGRRIILYGGSPAFSWDPSSQPIVIFFTISTAAFWPGTFSWARPETNAPFMESNVDQERLSIQFDRTGKKKWSYGSITFR